MTEILNSGAFKVAEIAVQGVPENERINATIVHKCPQGGGGEITVNFGNRSLEVIPVGCNTCGTTVEVTKDLKGSQLVFISSPNQ